MAGDLPDREIFIVDDDPLVRDALSTLFAHAGYRAVSFVDGPSFVAAARERIPACVILDIYMPGRSGLDILKDIDAPNYPAPIFIASGRGDIPSAVEAIKNGAFRLHRETAGCRNPGGAGGRRHQGSG
jgi:FixJ family two-component response regulator